MTLESSMDLIRSELKFFEDIRAKRKNSKMKAKISHLFSPEMKEFNQLSDLELSSRFHNSQTSTSNMLSALGEQKALFAKICQNDEQIFASWKARSGDIKKKLLVLQKDWQAVCEEKGLDPHMELSSLLNWIYQNAELSKLRQNLNALEKEIDKRKDGFGVLREDVSRWHRINESSKAISLSTYEHILSEANNILRYYEVKKESGEKKAEAQKDIAYLEKKISKSNQDMFEVEKAWSQLLDSYNLTRVSIEASFWEDIINLQHSFLKFEELAADMNFSSVFEKMISEGEFGQDSFCVLSPMPGHENLNTELLKNWERTLRDKAENLGSMLVLTGSKELAAALYQSGFPIMRRVDLNQTKPRSPLTKSQGYSTRRI